MSKKNKKFKRNKSRNILTPIQTTAANNIGLNDADIEISASGEASIKVETKKPEEVDPYTHNQYDHVKKDVRKILFIIAIIIIIFIGACILSAKTNVLASFGDWIYKIANIQAQ